jgi:hypothetical protein
MEKQIPTYYITIDELEDGGIDLISLVENPAIMIKGLAFSTEQKRFEFKYDEDKQIIAGPAIIPNLPIYRYDSQLGEYYVVFTKETIEKMVEKFNQNPKQLPINLEHTDELVPAFIKGSWIIEDSENDKSKMYGFTELPEGTFFIEVKVTDKKYWDKIKEQDKTGFSIEGIMGLTLSKIKEEFAINQGSVNSSNVDSFRYNDVSGELILTFNDGSRYRYYQIDLEEFENIVLGDAVCETEGENEFGRWFVGKTPSVGAAVWKYLRDKNVRYEKLSQVQENKLDEIRNKEELNKQELNKIKKNMKKLKFANYVLKDGTKIIVEGELAIGSPVFVITESGAEQAPAGQHTLEDGTVIYVDEEGLINEIESAETEVVEDENMKKDEEKMQVTPEEIMSVVNPIFEEMRTIVGELQARIEQLEGNSTPVLDEEMKEFSSVENLKFNLNKIRKLMN